MSSPHAPLVFRRSYSRAVKVVPVNTLADSVCIGWFKNFNYVYKITRSVVELNPTKKTAWKNRGASKSNKQCDLHTLHAIFITERILTNIKAQDKNVVHRIYYPILFSFSVRILRIIKLIYFDGVFCWEPMDVQFRIWCNLDMWCILYQ